MRSVFDVLAGATLAAADRGVSAAVAGVDVADRITAAVNATKALVTPRR
ncbi:hypothetical protein [Microbacterium sp. Bi128]|nr:hypothetical protein [Microbacterium sp. Bi128]